MKNCLPQRRTWSFISGFKIGHLKKLKVFLLILFSFVSSVLFAQTTITGRVASGDTALAGVTVQVKGTTTATQTNSEGRFSINGPSTATLVFTSIGYASQEVPVNNRTSIDVQLASSNTQLTDVVVVGYGTQRRATVTGSISNIKSTDITRTAATTTSGALVGKIQGITARMADGRPGNGTAIQIRNMGNPLYVIDGVPADAGQFNQIGIGDIEDISILKDASAAIYGLRAANGVILVTTKKGRQGKAQITVDGYKGYQDFTRFLKPPDAATYLRGLAWSNQNRGIANPTSINPTEIAKWEAGSEPGYQSVDYYDYIMGNGDIPQSYITAAASGGGNNSRYYFSVGNTSQDALIEDYYFKRTNIQANLETGLAKGLKIGTQLSARDERRHQTGVPGLDDYFNPMLSVFSMWPTETPYANNNPKYINNTHSVNINPATYPEVVTGYSDDIWRAMKGIFFAQYELPFGLSIKGTAQYNYTTNDVDEFEYTYDAYTYDAVNDKYNVTGGNQNPWRRKINRRIENRFGSVVANYNKKIGDHTIGAIAGYERYDEKNEWTEARFLPQNNTVRLVYFADQNIYNNTFDESARAGYIGRLNYNYKQKYIVEALGRYDGSYLYAKDNRWGLFPGVSVGWRISEEDFMSGSIGSIFSELKLRASYGETGSELGFPNNNTDGPTPFGYLQGYNYANRNAVFNGVLTTGVIPRGLPVTELTWVTNISKNIGVDFGVLNNKLTGTFDVFERKREGLPAQQNDLLLPIEVGYTYPNQNLESDAIRGVEGVLTFSNTAKAGFTYSLSINGTLARTKILERYNPRFSNSYDEWRNSQVDRWANPNFGYHVVGRFQSQSEIDKYPINNDGQGNRTQLPGDLIFEDANNDGIINGLDQRVLGYAQGANPYASFGFNTQFGYKGITLAIDLAGANMQTYYREFEAQIPFQNNGAGVAYLISDAWRRTDPFDANSAWIPGEFPAVRKDVPTHVNYANRNDFWMTNVKYVLLRNLQLAYNIPKKWMDKIHVTGLRIYAQGSNLFSIDNMEEFDLDPEVSSTNGLQYPQQRTILFGFNLNL